MKFRPGDLVICIREERMPSYVGTEWVVCEIVGQLYLCSRVGPSKAEDPYPFKDHEIVEASPLVRELL